MGTLHYGAPAVEYTVDDRTLAHLELVIFAKLRRNESLSFAIMDEATQRRQAFWISPSASVRFVYEAPMPEINKVWLQELIDAANSPGGLKILPEPEPASSA
ncbi:hypothetical protein K0817_004500 [Microbacterium sp. HD4P20]|uniref:DUF7882 family protein n=1 Tax=Microbacterium sp. HD4P20 TaxID=2864874 RepID=UPI001C643881|nr:hypothetical protein [Microbacterium sp. HD4P20]MCP2635827.1 hypothetical protein [Microbacterium sp. HD4P20]